VFPTFVPYYFGPRDATIQIKRLQLNH